LAKIARTLEGQFRYILFFRLQVFGPLSPCPQRALQASVLLFVESDIPLLSVIVVEILGSVLWAQSKQITREGLQKD
jgi:hypothetical protein